MAFPQLGAEWNGLSEVDGCLIVPNICVNAYKYIYTPDKSMSTLTFNSSLTLT